MKALGKVFKYGDNVDTDVIIPARYLNSSDPAELATHCMEDIDKDFVNQVKKGDIKMCIRDRSESTHETQSFSAELRKLKNPPSVYLTQTQAVALAFFFIF